MNLFSAENKTLNRFQFADFLDGLFNSPTMLHVENYINDEEGPISSPAKCKDLKVKNKNDLNFQVSYCTTSYHKYPQIKETFLKMVTYDKSRKHALIISIILDGFTTNHAAEFVVKFIQDISFQEISKGTK
jgi:hypothetical protein